MQRTSETVLESLQTSSTTLVIFSFSEVNFWVYYKEKFHGFVTVLYLHTLGYFSNGGGESY